MTGPLYSIRTSLGRELWWTTGRKKVLELAAQVIEPGHFNVRPGVGFTVQQWELPVAVYRNVRVK